MLDRKALLLTLAAAFLLLAACAGPQSHSRSVAGFSPASDRNSGSGTILTGSSLRDHGGNLLSFLRGRISGMTIEREGVSCPVVRMRGQRSLFGSNAPVVYVDGARATDSCVLEILPTRELRRVEVYPMGITNRPGYEAHPNGLILVFLDDGSIRPEDGRSDDGPFEERRLAGAI